MANHWNARTGRLWAAIGSVVLAWSVGAPSQQSAPVPATQVPAAKVRAANDKAANDKNAPIPVRFTDVREAAGITFLQDSTQTDEKLYLETMGTGVGWIDYDQDGLMDL